MNSIKSTNSDAPSPTLQQFTKDSTQVCILMAITLLFIIITMVGPFRLQGTALVIGKGVILVLLLYAFYKNVASTFQLTDSGENIFHKSQLPSLKTNVILNYIYSLSILFLFIYILTSLF